MLVAVASAPYLAGSDATASGVAALLFYLVAYGTMTFGFFAVILMLHRPSGRSKPWTISPAWPRAIPRIALMVTVLMLSLLGFPLTVGFTGSSLSSSAPFQCRARSAGYIRHSQSLAS